MRGDPETGDDARDLQNRRAPIMCAANRWRIADGEGAMDGRCDCSSGQVAYAIGAGRSDSMAWACTCTPENRSGGTLQPPRWTGPFVVPLFLCLFLFQLERIIFPNPATPN